MGQEECNGPAAAAVLAAGVGCLAMGLVTVLAEVSKAAKSAFDVMPAVGPLSGKVLVAVGLWLVVWVVFHQRWRSRHVAWDVVWKVTVALVVAGLLGTFPPVFGNL